MKTWCFLLFGLFVVNAHAQLDEAFVDDPNADGTVNKNAFGVVLNPFVVVALGGGSQHVHYGLQYRRLFKDNMRLRVSGFFQGNKELMEPAAPIGMTDTSFFAESGYNNYNVKELRFGFEWSNFKEKNDGFYGFDIITGIETQSSFDAVNEYAVSTQEQGSLYGMRLGADTLQYYTDQYLMLGVAPFFGYRVNIRDDWEICAWMSPEFVYLAPLKSDTHGVQQIHHQNPSINFRLRLLELVLSYRF